MFAILFILQPTATYEIMSGWMQLGFAGAFVLVLGIVVWQIKDGKQQTKDVLKAYTKASEGQTAVGTGMKALADKYEAVGKNVEACTTTLKLQHEAFLIDRGRHMANPPANKPGGGN